MWRRPRRLHEIFDRDHELRSALSESTFRISRGAEVRKENSRLASNLAEEIARDMRGVSSVAGAAVASAGHWVSSAASAVVAPFAPAKEGSQGDDQLAAARACPAGRGGAATAGSCGGLTPSQAERSERKQVDSAIASPRSAVTGRPPSSRRKTAAPSAATLVTAAPASPPAAAADGRDAAEGPLEAIWKSFTSFRF